MVAGLVESASTLERMATAFFAIAIIHTFAAAKIGHCAHHFPKDSARQRLLHLLGEVEVVFGLWAAIFLVAVCFTDSVHAAVEYVESRNFTEPAFVFVIMAMAATWPVLYGANVMIREVARWIPLPRATAFYWVTLTIGPLLGSFITEPAAMTVTALILLRKFFRFETTGTFRYITLSVLLVNISIGGTLTHFAAPPVLMVAETWGWDLHFMFMHFGWKATVATLLNATYATFMLRKELAALPFQHEDDEKSLDRPRPPLWLIAAHIAFLAATVYMAHHMAVFIGIFLLFMGLTVVTHYHQTSLQYEKSLLVSLFLGGLVVLGGLQAWWISPILKSLSSELLYVCTTLLTAVTDNAALTYLGSQVPDLTNELKYALVAGAVAGGGLTVIANAPNPAGFSILKGSFRDGVINPGRLFFRALTPTLIAMACLWFLP